MRWAAFNRWRRGWRAGDERVLSEAWETARTRLNRALYRYRNGLDLTDDELASAGAAMVKVFKLLLLRDGASDIVEFEQSNAVQYYVDALKLAALDHPDHDAWPARSNVRRLVLDGLEAQLAKKDDPWVRVAAITAALASRSLRRAIDLHAPIASDPFHSALVDSWVNQALMSWPSYNDRSTYESFHAETSREDPWNAPGGPPTEIRWVMLTAISPNLSVDPRTTLHAARSPAGLRMTLKRWWRIVDRPTATGAIEWLLHEGHRAQLARDLVEPDPLRPAETAFVAQHRDALARHGILGWDLGRLVDVARSARKLGYIEESELENVLELTARALRDAYRSWREYADDYMLGCNYYKPDVGPRCDHCANVRWLSADRRSPWGRVPFGGTSAWR